MDQKEKYWRSYHEALAQQKDVAAHTRVGYRLRSHALFLHACVREAIGNPSRQVIIDAGSGDGQVTAALTERNPVWAVDFSPSMLARAREAGLIPVMAKVTHLPFPTRSADLVVCVEVLQLMERPASLIAELARVLKPGGRLILTTLNSRSLLRRFRRGLVWRQRAALPHLMDEKTCEEALRSAGLCVSRFVYLAFFLRLRHQRGKSLLDGLLSFVATNFLVEAIRPENGSSFGGSHTQ